MDPLYMFRLPRSVNEMTHVEATEEIRDGERIKVTGGHRGLAEDFW